MHAKSPLDVNPFNTVGKEWWVSANWGLGAALRASFARTPDKTTGSAWLGYFAAALFSATYN